MKKKNIFLTILIMLMIIPNTILAFVSELGENIEPGVSEKVSERVATILGVIQWIGYGLAIGMLLYIGIKYMMAAANEKASLKQTLINYVIGAIIVFGITTIFTITTGFFGVSGEQNSQQQGGGGAGGGSPIIGDEKYYLK